MENYSDMSLADLRLLAKEKKISGYSALRKQELVDMLSRETNDSTDVEKQPAKNSEKTDKTEAPKNAVKAAVKETGKTTVKEAGETVVKEAGKTAVKEAGKTGTQTIRRSVVAAGTQSAAAKEKPVQTIGNRAAQPAEQPQTTQSRESGSPEAEKQVRTDERRIVRRVVGVTGTRPENRTDNRADNRADNRPDNRQQRDAARRPATAQGDMGMDSGILRKGILEIPADQNFGFLRNDNYLPSEKDVYISPAMIRTYNLSTGDVITGTLRVQQPNEKYPPLHHITKINDQDPELAMKRRRFDRLTPVFPHERLHLEYPGCDVSMRITDMFSPIGKGQRGMIVSQPKAGKTTLLKQIAKSILTNHKSVHLIILLIDERPEEVTDFKDYVSGTNAEVIYSTFDEEPEQHRRVSEMTLERAKRLVEYGEDVVILLDSITRLARAYNLICVSSGRTLSGGLDPNALFMPKKFFGAARCMKEGGSMTILATALVETGSRMDDVVFEEFKGTGNMELVLDRNLSERRIFPAIDLQKSSTRREDLLLNTAEQTANNLMRRAFNGNKAEESIEQIINLFTRTRNNVEFMQMMSKMKFQ